VSIGTVGGLISGLVAVAIALVWIFQERIAFQPPAQGWISPPDSIRVEYTAADGQPLVALLIGKPDASTGLLLSFHGNADLSVWQIEWAKEVLARSGVPVLLAEYRGYMGLPGRSTYHTSRLDAEAAYAFARDTLGIPPGRIAFFGHSLGTAVAADLSRKHRPAALLLQSPFTSAHDMSARMIGLRLPPLIWNTIARLHFDTRARVSGLDAPVSVAHGGADRLIPARMGREVFTAARKKGSLLVVTGAAHNDVASHGRDFYWQWVVSALREAGLP
jgi:fermentation-respiration switch protein FrsA (DUF1100 family)